VKRIILPVAILAAAVIVFMVLIRTPEELPLAAPDQPVASAAGC